MHRILALSVAILLATQFALAAGTTKSISVTGKLSGDTSVSASCSVSSAGKASGAGRFSGKNTNGTTFSYPFTVNKVTTGLGTITLSGNFDIAGSPPITLTAAVPSGAQKFTYVVNGKIVTYTGTGTVMVK